MDMAKKKPAQRLPYEDIAARIEEARLQLGANNAANGEPAVTQVALAKTVGVSSGMVSQWLAGSSKPGLPNLWRLGQALEVSPGWLTFGPGNGMGPQRAEDATVQVGPSTLPPEQGRRAG